MPPSIRAKPEFHIWGRYALMVSDRKLPGPTYFHDTENLKEECGLEGIDASQMSRFNNTVWAGQRNYSPCPSCIGVPL